MSVPSLKNIFQTVSFATALENPNAVCTRENTTAFHYLVRREQLAAGQVAQLVAAGALINRRDAGNDSPLSAAVKNQDLPVINALLRAGADVGKYETETGISLLACVRAYAQNRIYVPESSPLPDPVEEAIVSALLEAGADPDGMDDMHTPLLFHYIACGSASCVAALLEAGADPNLRAKNSPFSALHHATLRRNTELMKLLLDAGANPDSGVPGQNNFSSPLVSAIEGRNTASTALLLEYHADPAFSPGNPGKTPLLAALRLEEYALTDLLLARRPDIINLPNSYHWFPLHCALIERLPLKAIAYLLEHGADPNQPGQSSTPLHMAVTHGQLDVVDLLLRFKADPLLQSKAGETAYQLSGKIHGPQNSITARLQLAELAALQQLKIAGKKTIDVPSRHP